MNTRHLEGMWVNINSEIVIFVSFVQTQFDSVIEIIRIDNENKN